jgi:hypothetical protein
MSNTTEELKDRIEARRHLLQAKLAELKADTRHEAGALRDKISAGLADLEDTLKDGWDKVSDGVRTKLNAWLDNNN